MLCDSRESAEDLVQETIARILARPRWLRGGDELAYLTQALRNTFLTSKRTAARRPRAVMALEEFDPADSRTDERPEEALIIGQVFPAIARLPESFRLALVAVDIAGLSHREAARVLGAPEATITTRLHRARQRVARELDPERSDAPRSKGTRRAVGADGGRCWSASSWSELTRSTVARKGASPARRDPSRGPRDTRMPTRDDPGLTHARERDPDAIVSSVTPSPSSSKMPAAS